MILCQPTQPPPTKPTARIDAPASGREGAGTFDNARNAPGFPKTVATVLTGEYRAPMPVRFTMLGSGSAGNCSYLETDETRILIDAGFSGRQIRKRLESIGRTPERLDGILISHEHSDHTQGLGTIAAKLQIPVYCNRLTREAIEGQVKDPLDFRIFNEGARFEIGDIEVENFSVPHDAYDPVGFLLRTRVGNIGVLTDLGHATRSVIERARQAHVLLLECNYDQELLERDTKRPWSIKQRILSRHGHLSNDAAAELLEQAVTPDLRRVYLVHLSRDCNSPEHARRAIEAGLQRADANHVEIESTAQDTPNPTFVLQEAPPVGGQSLLPF